jgi:thiol-disulfide isomerase/thioredoxin
MKTFTRNMLSALSLSLLCGLAHADQNLQSFTAESLTQIEAQHEGQPFVLVLWSMHCAPCFAELEMLGTELRRQPDLPVVLVSTDEVSMREEVIELLADYGLENVPTWQFSEDIPEKLRFVIDQDWYGELPRSYYYDADHQRSSHSGTLSQEQLATWLDTEG